MQSAAVEKSRAGRQYAAIMITNVYASLDLQRLSHRIMSLKKLQGIRDFKTIRIF